MNNKALILAFSIAAVLSGCGGDSGEGGPQGLSSLPGTEGLDQVDSGDPGDITEIQTIIGTYQLPGYCNAMGGSAMIINDPSSSANVDDASVPLVMVYPESDGAYIVRGTVTPVGTTSYGYSRFDFVATDLFLTANDVGSVDAVAADQFVVPESIYAIGDNTGPAANYDSNNQTVPLPSPVMSALGGPGDHTLRATTIAGLNQPQGDGLFSIDLDKSSGAIYVAEGQPASHEWDNKTCYGGDDTFDYNNMWQRSGTLSQEDLAKTILNLYLPARDNAWQNYSADLSVLVDQRNAAISADDGTFDGTMMPAGWSYDQFFDARLGELVRDYRDSVIGPINNHLASLQSDPTYVPFEITGAARSLIFTFMANEERRFRASVSGASSFDGTAFETARGNLYWHWNAIIANDKQP